MRFILVDKVVRIEKGKEGVFLKNVSQSEDYFEDHFPGSPIMPGSLILESFEQASQLLIGFSHGFGVLAQIARIRRANFKHYVVPGDQLTMFLSLSALDGKECSVEAKTLSGDRLMAEATLDFLLIDRNTDSDVAESCGRIEELYRLLASDPVSRAWENLGRHQSQK